MMSRNTMACKTFMHRLEGHVFVETIDEQRRWVARLECSTCGTRRVDVMMPQTCELVSRKYEYEGCADYDRSVDRTEAKKALFKLMLKG